MIRQPYFSIRFRFILPKILIACSALGEYRERLAPEHWRAPGHSHGQRPRDEGHGTTSRMKSRPLPVVILEVFEDGVPPPLSGSEPLPVPR